MQVLASKGLEFGEQAGLDWIAGTVQPLNAPGLRLPHIGWNEVIWRASDPIAAGLEDVPDFYFLHGYAFTPDDPATIVATASYGEEFCAVVRSNNIVGVSFTPRRASARVLALLRNFLALS
jgi:glutamine amidotransferase